MKLTRIVNLWPPFTELVLLRADPAHYHVLAGASSQLYVLIGSQVMAYNLDGASEQLYVIEGSE